MPSMTRSVFGFACLLWLVLTGPSAQSADDLKWFRGQLHAHTHWSDGRGLPEQAVDAYQQRGYDFLCLSEHNRFAGDTNTWREVAKEEGPWPPKVTQAVLGAYVERFGADSVESRTNGPSVSVRLKNYSELKTRFENPGKFILLPGVELTQQLNGIHVHMNYVNIPTVIPSLKGANLVKSIQSPSLTVSELIRADVSEVEQAATERQVPGLLMLNHPFWQYYDIQPQNLIDGSPIRFFEVCNGGSDHAPSPRAPAYTVEKFWDVVNAFRRIQGQPLLYAVGSDDAHFYDAKRIDGVGGVGDAWVMVRAAALTPQHLVEAMRQGDFYATCGILLEEVAFTPADRTLRVKVKAEAGANYRIDFIATRRGFDRTATALTIPAEKKRPGRTLPVYSDDIGRTVKSVTGTEAAYRMETDDLYVRARVESDRPSKIAPHFHPKVQTAWTQPYADGDQ